MELWLLLILIGLITYFIIKHNVANITRTPLWLFWLVMMAPALIWSVWWLVFGEDRPIPFLLLVVPFIVCPLLYWWLIEIGRPVAEVKETAAHAEKGDRSETAKNKEDSAKVRPITPNEETILRNCFPWSIYYLQNIDYRPQAILCRGKLRAIPEVAYKTIETNIKKAFGDRFVLLFQESFQGQPFFALVPNPWADSQQQGQEKELTRPFLASGLLALTFLTTSFIGMRMSGISSEQFQAETTLLWRGLPYSLSIIAILGVHELSHYVAAVYYKIRTTLPYFIPFPDFLGTFGAFVQMRSPVPHRKALFDVAIAGPIGGFLMTLPLFLWGLSLSQVVPLEENMSFLNFQALDPRFSFLVSVCSKSVLGSQLIPGMAIALHPVAIAGYIGVIFTALNLMPVGQLDGGHIVHAMFGQRTAIVIGQIARLFMFVLAILKLDFLIWAIILFLMPIGDRPALNDVTELDNRRDLLGLLSLALLLSILLPVPDVVAQWVNL